MLIFNVVAHACPSLRPSSSDIGLVVCTAWAMWHQSDLQNNCGGPINQIGSGINHCAEDILCHRCPLAITPSKMLTLSLLLPSILLFPASHDQPTKWLLKALKWKRERCPFHHSFKMQVKVYRVAFMSGTWKAFQWDDQKTIKSLLFRLTSGLHFIPRPSLQSALIVTANISSWEEK